MTTHRLFYLVKFKLETSVLNWSSLYLTLFWCNCLGNCHLILSLLFMSCKNWQQWLIPTLHVSSQLQINIGCSYLNALNSYAACDFLQHLQYEIWATACKSRKSLRQMVCLPCVIWSHSNSCTEPMKLQPDSWNWKNLFSLQLECSKRKWNEVFWKNC